MYKPLMALVASVAVSGALYTGDGAQQQSATQVSQIFPSTEVAGISVSLGLSGGGYRGSYGGGYYPGYYYSTPYYYDNDYYYDSYPGYYYSTPYYYRPSAFYGSYGNSWGGGYRGYGGWGGHHHRH